MRTTAPLAEHGNLASQTAQRQGLQLGWSLAGLVVTLLTCYLIALGLQQAGMVTQLFPQTVAWCALPFLLAAHWLYRGAGLPGSERRSLLLVTTATPFLLMPLGFALLQQPYSRGAVLLVYVLSTCWFVLGDWLHRRRHVQRLAFLDASVPDSLHTFLRPESPLRRELELLPWSAADLDTLFEVDGVVLDRRVPPTHERSQLLSVLKLNHVRLYSVEAVAELLSGRKMLTTEQDDLWQIDGNPAHDLAKRVLDTTIVLAMAPLWLPVCALIGLVVRLDSPGPALFSQSRVGRNGRSFRLWKFRSMRHDAQSQSARFAQQRDERITSAGRILRRWRLDELPQLWNVLLGQMSLIGPRPEQTQFVHAFATQIRAYPYRHLVRPGLTGWAQVQQGYAEGEEEAAVKLSYDLYYVAHYSMALDLLIAYKTVRILLSGFGSR